jgi:chemotaxis protein CheX
MTLVTTSAIDVLVGATTDVFETMVFRALSAKEPSWGYDVRPKAQVVGTVGFTGSSNGLVAFHATTEVAREVASAMLGGPVEDDALPDVVGEITNMIAGAFRTRMARPDDLWAITVPTVTSGTDFSIKPITTGDRAIVGFDMDGHELFVELIITPAVGTA